MGGMNELDARALNVLDHLVDIYLETRAPVGSLALAKRLIPALSPATVRYIVAELEELSLVTSLHTSSGRIPTEKGLRSVMKRFLAMDPLSDVDKKTLEHKVDSELTVSREMFEGLTAMLSSLSMCAGIVKAPLFEPCLEHVGFVCLEAKQVLAMLVMLDGTIVKHVMPTCGDIKDHHLQEAANYLNAHIRGKTLHQARDFVAEACEEPLWDMDRLSHHLVKASVTLFKDHHDEALIVRGQDFLLKTWVEANDLHTLKVFLDTQDVKKDLLTLLDLTIQDQVVQIFVGSQSLLKSSHCAVVVAPYHDRSGDVVGAVGVLGPTYMDYRRIVPMVDYTATLLGRVMI
ncbi:heat-inducible transcription repressor HrcA [bacterium NHP-B]|nr:heat-inducible transcription repressor HrcA [bacterium NHP-B]